MTTLSRDRMKLRPAFLILIILFLTVPVPARAAGARDPEPPAVPVVTDFPLPESLSICREPMPLEDQWVWEMLDRELTIAAWDRAQVFMWLKRANRYFPSLEKKLRHKKMPRDIKYLAVAESSLRIDITSPKGALGPWQFMAGTARRMGLRKEKRIDERRDFDRATEAALAYLGMLRETFESWTVALAAYNCGEARMKREMKEQGENNYYRLNLPAETERFVYRIAAIKLVMENPETYGFRVPEDKLYGPIRRDETRISVDTSPPVHLRDLAKGIGTHLKAIKDLNPQIIGYTLPSGNYTLRTPVGTGSKVKSTLRRLVREASRTSSRHPGRHYIVKPGDSLIAIARETGVPVSKLKKLNGIKGSLIRVGQRLRLRP